MFQSYKTNRCCPAGLVWLFLLTALQPFCLAAKPTAKREWKQFLHYERTFQVPENQKDALWEYVLKRYMQNSRNISTEHFEFSSSNQYFDDDFQNILHRHSSLFQQTIFAADGQQQKVELWEKSGPDWLVTTFKENKRPDKWKKFTAHPLLKLLRAKDRPGLDSLLQRWQLDPLSLKPILETTAHQYRLMLRLRGSDWLILTLREVQSEAPGYLYYDLNINPDRKFYTGANKAHQQQLRFITDTLASQLQKQFPEIKPETRNSYEKMIEVRQSKVPGLIRNKILFGLILFFAFLLFFILKRPVKKWIKGKWVDD